MAYCLTLYRRYRLKRHNIAEHDRTLWWKYVYVWNFKHRSNHFIWHNWLVFSQYLNNAISYLSPKNGPWRPDQSIKRLHNSSAWTKKWPHTYSKRPSCTCPLSYRNSLDPQTHTTHCLSVLLSVAVHLILVILRFHFWKIFELPSICKKRRKKKLRIGRTRSYWNYVTLIIIGISVN